MKPSDILGICVRVLGLFGFLGGVGYALGAVCMALWGQSQHQGFYSGQYLLCGIVFGAVGLYFLRGAPHLVRFAYRDEKKIGPSVIPTTVDEP